MNRELLLYSDILVRRLLSDAAAASLDDQLDARVVLPQQTPTQGEPHFLRQQMVGEGGGAEEPEKKHYDDERVVGGEARRGKTR